MGKWPCVLHNPSSEYAPLSNISSLPLARPKVVGAMQDLSVRDMAVEQPVITLLQACAFDIQTIAFMTHQVSADRVREIVELEKLLFSILFSDCEPHGICENPNVGYLLDLSKGGGREKRGNTSGPRALGSGSCPL